MRVALLAIYPDGVVVHTKRRFRFRVDGAPEKSGAYLRLRARIVLLLDARIRSLQRRLIPASQGLFKQSDR